jgi:recombinational DNA repair protein (RecF pathway)
MPARLSPELAKKLMIDADLTPLEEYVNSTTPWRCTCNKCGHEVKPTLAVIRRGGGGCVYCAGIAVDPEEAKALFISNDLIPLVPYPGAGMPWQSTHTKCGREVTPTYSNVRSGHTGCKYCVGNIVDESKARALFLSRGLLPLEPYKNALSPWLSIHQECGKEVSPKFNSVQQGSSGCIYCGGNAPIDPIEAEKFFIEQGLKPLVPFVSTGLPWPSIHVKCGRQVSPRYSGVKAGGSGCKYCSKVFINPIDAARDLRSYGFEPLVEYSGSNRGWKAIHTDCGRTVSPILNSLKKGVSGCIYCSGNRIDPELAREVFLSKGLVPQSEFPGGKVPWPSIHSRCGTLVSPKYADVSNDSNGCKKCAPNFVEPEEAVSIFRSADLEPLEPYPGADRGWKSRHTVCGREVTPRFGYVRRNGAGCRYCAGKLVDPTEASEFMSSKGLIPQEAYPGAQTPWSCLHDKCGRIVTPTYNGIRWSQSGGCKYCADSGMDYGAPASLYLINHEEFGAHKVGIGGIEKKRIEQHSRLGWKTYKTLDFDTGDAAHAVEQKVISWFRNELGLFPYLSREEMPQGGYTETVDASEIDMGTIWAKVLELSKVKK